MDQQTLYFSLILIVSGSVSVTWKMTCSPKVTASRGEDVVLNCSISPDKLKSFESITVKWIARDQHADPFFTCSVRYNSLEEPNDCLASILQFSLLGDPRRGELSLLITNVQLTNEGTFFCKVELDRWQMLQEKIRLDVKGKPQILSLSVENATCAQKSSVSQWLKCEVEGNPLPKVVWLSSSKRLLEDQGHSLHSGEWSRTACVPYLKEEEDQVITCRAENSEGHAEKDFPESEDVRMIVIVVSVIVMMLLSAVFIIIVIMCLRKHRQKQASDRGAELQPVYSEINCDPSAQVNSMQSRQKNMDT
ncbi:hypothetical protein CHARACLAT_019884, partial [Characodon lateralis]|nr:hypothetical protein [Characodon lateralis]